MGRYRKIRETELGRTQPLPTRPRGANRCQTHRAVVGQFETVGIMAWIVDNSVVSSTRGLRACFIIRSN
jgi:hypothetical protein